MLSFRDSHVNYPQHLPMIASFIIAAQVPVQAEIKAESRALWEARNDELDYLDHVMNVTCSRCEPSGNNNSYYQEIGGSLGWRRSMVANCSMVGEFMQSFAHTFQNSVHGR